MKLIKVILDLRQIRLRKCTCTYKCKCTSASTNVHLRDVSHTDVSHTDQHTHGQRGNTLQTGGFNTSSNTNDIGRRFWLRLVMNMFLAYRIWYGWEKYPGIRALMSLSSVKKFEPTISWILLQQGKANQLRTTEWTSRQKMCFLTTNISSLTPHITLQPGPFERLIWNHLVNFLTLTIYLHK